MSRHLAPVPDLPHVEYVRRDPAEDGRGFRRHPLTLIGEPATEPPGWWVCPDCGRRRDRAGEPRTVTSVLCTGPAAPYSRRHRPTEMRVHR